jgi:hypothetical protein
MLSSAKIQLSIVLYSKISVSFVKLLPEQSEPGRHVYKEIINLSQMAHTLRYET